MTHLGKRMQPSSWRDTDIRTIASTTPRQATSQHSPPPIAALPPKSPTMMIFRHKRNTIPGHANAPPHPPPTENMTDPGADAKHNQEARGATTTKAPGSVCTIPLTRNPRCNWSARCHISADHWAKWAIPPSLMSDNRCAAWRPWPIAPRGLRNRHEWREPTSSPACP